MEKNKRKPITTLFLIMSLDGKISTGSTDEFDVDRDFPNTVGLKEGIHQYYEIEQTTDLWSLNSGKVQKKVGVNNKKLPAKCGDVSFVVIDNNHLNKHGVEYFSCLSKSFVLVTENKNHPAFDVEKDNINILYYETFDPLKMLEDLYEKFDCTNITIQTGGTLNDVFLKRKQIDYVDIIVAPVLIGGKDTPTLIDGKSLTSKEELKSLGILKLIKSEVLQNSYIRLKYKVINN